MTDLEKYELVNKCETVEDLEAAILTFTDPETGLIKGRMKSFDGAQMASRVRPIVEENGWPNNLTREFGIRQQALYIKYYTRERMAVQDFIGLVKPFESKS